MIGRYPVIGAGLVLVVAMALRFFHTIDLKCQMTCLEYDVEKFRTDFWDLGFLRFQLCRLRKVPECNNSYSVKIDKWAQVFCVSFNNDTRHFNISLPSIQDIQKLKKFRNERDFFNIHQLLHVNFNDVSGHRVLKYSFEHRRTRFLYYDFLDLGFGYTNNMTTAVNLSIEGRQPQNIELWNALILLVSEMHKESFMEEGYNVTSNADLQKNYTGIGSDMFNQYHVILTDEVPSYFLSSTSTLVCIWFFLILCYFVNDVLKSSHGSTDELYFRRIFFTGDRRRMCNIFRPDLIPVGEGNLRILWSNFYRPVYEFKEACYDVLFFYVWLICIDEIMKTKDLEGKPQDLYVFLFLIGTFLFFIRAAVLFVLFLSLSFIAPQMFTICIRYEIHIFHFEIAFSSFLCFLLALFFLFFIVFNFESKILEKLQDWDFSGLVLVQGCSFQEFPYRKAVFHRIQSLILRNVDTVPLLLWPAWPTELLFYVTNLIKNKCNLAGSVLYVGFLVVFCITGYYFEPFVEPGSTVDTRDWKNRMILFYWLFGPVSWIVVALPFCYKRKILLGIEVFSTALFVVVLCSYPFRLLYPSLKLLKQGELVLYVILTLTFFKYLLKIYREWYENYDKYLKDVVSYVSNKYTCKDNKTDLNRNKNSIALVYNHIDDGETCQHHEENQGRVNKDQYNVKGLVMLIKNSNIYVTSDFFFEVIKIPGAPGAIKWVVAKEISVLVFVRLFPAVFIYWLCRVMFTADYENYSLVVAALLQLTIFNQYMELFLYRKNSVVDVKGNIAFQRQIDKFLGSYESWFLVKQDAELSICRHTACLKFLFILTLSLLFLALYLK